MATVTKSYSSFSGLRTIGLKSPLKKKAIITVSIVCFASDVEKRASSSFVLFMAILASSFNA